MISTSRMSGTSSSVVRPGASNAAAISFSALFFAPVIRTRPRSADPPVTSKQSTRSPYGGPAAGSHRALASGGARQGPSSSLVSMTVRLTRIYTRTGDAGQTHLGDMSRVSKTDPRLVASADVDETNSAIGVAVSLVAPSAPVAEPLGGAQNCLFDVGADLS